MPPPSPREILRLAIVTAPAAGSVDQHVQHFLDTLHDNGARIALRGEPRTHDMLAPIDLRVQTTIFATAMAGKSPDQSAVAARVPEAFQALANLQCSGYVIAETPAAKPSQDTAPPTSFTTSFEARR